MSAIKLYFVTHYSLSWVSSITHVWFLIAVHCDITQWYMTNVMATNRSIYLFTPERPRDLSARAPGPACQEYYNTITRAQICLF